MTNVSVSGVSGGSAGEARTAGTMNIYQGPVYNSITVKRQDENSDESIQGLQDLVSKLPGDTQLLSPQQQETTVMLIGKTGAGKSSLGNTILGRGVFRASATTASVTKGVHSARDGHLEVIDTQGLFETDISYSEILQDIQREVFKSVVHVVIFVMRVGRYTEEDKLTVEKFKQLLGVDWTRHMIVVFTHKEDLDDSDMTLEDYVNYQPQHMRQLLKDCGDRYLAVNNRCKKNERFKLSLMDHINQVKRLTGGSGIRIAQPELGNTQNDVCNII